MSTSATATPDFFARAAAVPAASPRQMQIGMMRIEACASCVAPMHEAQVRPRSGLALKYGITVLNTPGTIDAGYRGEIGVVLANFGESAFKVAKGDKIAQLVIAPVLQPEVVEAYEIDETDRGAGGFGSTGV